MGGSRRPVRRPEGQATGAHHGIEKQGYDVQIQGIL